MLPVGYSSNLHAAESVADLVRVIGGFTAEVRRRLGWPRLGLDLRLGSAAIAELRDAEARANLRRALDQAGASAYTLNAFPLRPFQEAVVKTNVYLPDWTEAGRENDNVALIPIALALSDEPVVTISTLPGSFKPFGPERNDAGLIAAALGRWAGVAAHARRDIGRTVILCLEPEPWCFLENSQEVAEFWRGPLRHEGLAACAGLLGGDVRAASDALARHLGICFDTCHFSLAFEDQVAAVAKMQAAGATIAKCQFSAAPEVRDPNRDPAGLAALRALAEPRFLHQTAAIDAAGRISQVQDLDQLDACLARLTAPVAVRSHFHTPVFRPATERGLSSTIDDSLRGLAACLAAGCAHVAVETYTWSILAENERDALDGTVKELAFTAEAAVAT